MNWGVLTNWALGCKAAELGNKGPVKWGVLRNWALECKAIELGSVRRLSWGVCQVLKHAFHSTDDVRLFIWDGNG